MIKKHNPKNKSTKERISLIVEKLSKIYDDGTVAVKDLSFKLHDGEILGLVGPNGAGKTTTLKCLMNLIEPSEGEIRIKGFSAGTREAKFSIAYIPEIPILYNDLTVREHLKFVTMASTGYQRRKHWSGLTVYSRSSIFKIEGVKLRFTSPKECEKR